jgi:uncharacterized protein (DUF1015 family)
VEHFRRGRNQIHRTQFAQIPFLYIADGHHRSAAAARVFQSRKGAGQSGQFLAVIFPHNQMQILPYNRVLKDLNGLTPAELLKKLEEVFNIIRLGVATPARKHELGLFMNRRWHTLTFKPKLTAAKDPIEQLDVTLLQKLFSRRCSALMIRARAKKSISSAASAARRNWKSS